MGLQCPLNLQNDAKTWTELLTQTKEVKEKVLEILYQKQGSLLSVVGTRMTCVSCWSHWSSTEICMQSFLWNHLTAADTHQMKQLFLSGLSLAAESPDDALPFLFGSFCFPGCWGIFCSGPVSLWAQRLADLLGPLVQTSFSSCSWMENRRLFVHEGRPPLTEVETKGRKQTEVKRS